MRWKFLFALLLITHSANAQTADVLYCTAEATTGFGYSEKSKRYEPTNFVNTRHTIKFDDRAMTAVVATNTKSETYTCTMQWGKVIQCIERTYFMTFSHDKSRYYRAQMFGNLTEPPGVKGDAVTVEMGTCTKF